MEETLQFYRYWGKARKGDGEGEPYHLLAYHSLDVAAVGWRLLDPLGARCRGLAAALNVEPRWLQAWFSFCLSVHDLGKFSRSFQGVAPNLSSALVAAKNNFPYDERHDSLGFVLWLAVVQPYWVNSFGLAALGSGFTKHLPQWIEIVTGHHGVPPKRVGKMRPYLNKYFCEEDEQAAADFCTGVHALFLSDCDISILADTSLNARVKKHAWQLAGLAVLADWLGSDEHIFRYESVPKPLCDYWHNTALKRADEVLEKAELAAPVVQKFENINTLFPFITTPTPLQQWSIAQILPDDPQLFLLEDVTGAGKTEAALILAHRLMSHGLADGLYIGLPTMATANGMYERMAQAYRKLYQVQEKPSLVLAHGARDLSPVFRHSVALGEQAEDRPYGPNEPSASAYCSSWIADSSKTALLADVGVGTLDQALLAILPARHQSLRMLGLARKVIIVDEVHAYDSYMQGLLAALLEAQARQGGCAILLSATLPHAMRQTLVNAYKKGRAGLLAPLKKTGYPLATHVSSAGCAEHTVATRDGLTRRVRVELLAEEAQVYDMIKHAAAGQCVCWVRNTVKDALKAYDDLRQILADTAYQLTLFHSRFAMIDRLNIENDIKTCFGDKSTPDQRRGRIVIATQVVEQSLDLDFDFMVSDLAPIDLLIQRAGRLHRHVRDKYGMRLREDGAQDQRGGPQLYVLSPDPRACEDADWLKRLLPGTQAVYRHVGQLWLTASTLQRTSGFTMPDDAREVIEGVYGDQAQGTYPAVLEHASGEASGRDYGKKTMADYNVLALEKGYTRASADKSGGWDEEVNIPTRLEEQKTVTIALARVEKDRLMPYADVKDDAWALSKLSVPETLWLEFHKQLPEALKTFVEREKKKYKALKWAEVAPMTPEAVWYKAVRGFTGIADARDT